MDPEATPSLAELKKAEKLRAKKERKAQAGGEAMDSETNKSDAYDFSVDFWKNPMTRVTGNNTNDFAANTNASSSTASSFFSQFSEMNEEESGESSEDDDEGDSAEGEVGSDESDDDDDDVR